MSLERKAISMPARPEDLLPVYETASSMESEGSDDVFESFEERHEEEFFRLLEQRKSDDIGECFKVDAKRLDTKNQDETVLSSASTYYSTVSHDSALKTADLQALSSDQEQFEFQRVSTSTNASEPVRLRTLSKSALDPKKPPAKPEKKELFISLAELEKLTLEDNDAENEFEQDAEIFKLKTWNHVSLWKWDVDCDICAICRVVVTEPCLKCQTSGKGADECAVVWGECNHSYHNCCMSRWVATSPRCPLCQGTWVVQRIGT